MRKLWAAGAAMVVWLALTGLPAVGQEASPATVSIERELLYEITVPVSAIPDLIGKIGVSGLTIAPGTDVSIPYDNEAFLGHAMRVQSGELVVTPAYDALLWTGDAARGGTPVTAPGGQAVHLSVGDVLLLPAIPREELDPTKEVGIANPGTTDTVTSFFHLHWWEMGPTWPTGITLGPRVEFFQRPELERVQAGDTVFRLTELTLQPGAALPYPEDAAFAIDYVEGGTLVFPTGADLGPGKGTIQAPSSGLAELTAGGEVPAVVLELAVIPSVEANAPVPEAQAGEGNVWVTGTVACTVTTEWTTTTVEGVEQWRGRVADCEWFASDPRMSGPFSITQDMDCYELTSPDTGWACVLWGTFEGSGWTGSLITPVDPSGIGTDHIIQTGTGANAGLTFVGTNTQEGWSGLLYEGDPPPSGPLPSPASE